MRSRWLVVGGVGLVAAVAAVVLVPSGDAPRATRVLEARDGIVPTMVFDEASAREVGRDEYSVTEVDDQGLYRATVSVEPSNVLRDGEWVPVSAHLTEGAGDSLVAEDHPMVPELAASANAESLIQLGSGDEVLEIGLIGADDAPAAVSESSHDGVTTSAVTYPEAVGGDDLIVTVTPNAVHQRIVLDEAPEQALTYEWSVRAPGLTLVDGESGEMVFKDANDEVVYVIPGPVMWDSLSAEDGPADSASAAIDYEVEAVGEGEWAVTIHPDQEWLASSERVYPVFIDPDVYPGATVHTYKENNWTYNYGTQVRIGNSAETGTCCAWRTVMQYPLSTYYGKRLVEAGLGAVVTYGTTTAQTATLYWANSFSFAGNGAQISDFTISSSGGSSSAGTYDMIAHYLHYNDPYSYVMLTGQESDAVYGRKDLTTYVTFTYVLFPTFDGLASSTPTTAAGQPLTNVDQDGVVMQGQGTNNYTGTVLQYKYDFTTTTPGAQNFSTGWVADGPYRIPSGQLTPGADYTYEVSMRDTGYSSPVIKPTPLSTWAFHVRTAPGAVTQIGVSETQGGTVSVLDSDRTVTDARPWLHATVEAGDSGTVWALFTVTQVDDSGNPIAVVVDSLPGSAGAVTPGGSRDSIVRLPYALDPGKHYVVDVQAFDGHAAGPSQAAAGKLIAPARGYAEITGGQDTATGEAP